MGERLTRYDLGDIKQTHDRAHYTCVSPDHLAQQLRRIGLPPNASRFEVAEKVRQIERDIDRHQGGI